MQNMCLMNLMREMGIELFENSVGKGGYIDGILVMRERFIIDLKVSACISGIKELICTSPMTTAKKTKLWILMCCYAKTFIWANYIRIHF